MENLTTGMQPAFLLLIFHRAESSGKVGVERGGAVKNELKRRKSEVILKHIERQRRRRVLWGGWMENDERK